MTDYGLKFDTHEIISGSTFLFRSGTLANPATSISASVPQIIAITCSANFNNRLTKLTSINANATITITSGSSDIQNLENDTKLILRYYSGSGEPTELIPSSSDSTVDHLLGGIQTNIIFVDIPLLNNDDSFTVAYKTVRALTASIGHNRTYTAALVDDGSTFKLSSSLGENMKIGTTFKVRNSSSFELPNDYLLSSSGFFTITSLNSGSVATPDFSGTEVQVGGMQIGTSFMIGGGSGSQAFDHNIIQAGFGTINQSFFPGIPVSSSASIGITLDPNDKTSGLITGSGTAKLYLSSSGRVGIGTDDPDADVDILATEIKFRNADETGIRMNKEGNFESFVNSTGQALTGSELILKSTRNEEGRLDPGDVIGSLRWISTADTEDERKGAEAASIRGIVETSDSSGITSHLSIRLAESTDEGSLEKVRIDKDGTVHITGSLKVTGTINSVGTDTDTTSTINGGSF